jgi:hypothetical protein
MLAALYHLINIGAEPLIIKSACLFLKEWLECPNEQDFTPWGGCILSKNYVCAQILMDHGADINRTDASGATILHFILKSNSYSTGEIIEFVDLLVAWGFDLTKVDADNISVLHQVVIMESTREPKSAPVFPHDQIEPLELFNELVGYYEANSVTINDNEMLTYALVMNDPRLVQTLLSIFEPTPTNNWHEFITLKTDKDIIVMLESLVNWDLASDDVQLYAITILFQNTFTNMERQIEINEKIIEDKKGELVDLEYRPGPGPKWNEKRRGTGKYIDQMICKLEYIDAIKKHGSHLFN